MIKFPYELSVTVLLKPKDGVCGVCERSQPYPEISLYELKKFSLGR